jgi:prepilin-type N-terminal cleavage/methylation domain-containing protein
MYPKTHKGFTLIEMLVTIWILLLMLVVIGGLVSAFPLLRFSKHQDLALKIATTEIDALRALGYDSLPASGSISSSLLSALPSGAGARTVTDINDATKEVHVAVSWVETSGNAHEVVLTTFITEVGGLP